MLTQGEIHTIAADVRYWLGIGYRAYLGVTGLEAGTDAQNRWLARKHALPAALAEWLDPDYVNAFLSRVPPRPDPPTRQEVIAAAAAAAYGPRGSAPPAARVTALCGSAFAGGEGARLAIERVLVDGLLLPSIGPPEAPPMGAWSMQWSAARDSLLELLRRTIGPAVYWIGTTAPGLQGPFGPVDPSKPATVVAWASPEQACCAAILRGWLLDGCACWHQASHLGLDASVARTRCDNKHRLSTWDRTEPLGNFLQEVTTGGNHLRVNDFKYEMLAKCVADFDLRSGEVFVCGRPGCNGIIQRDNHCGTCGQLAAVRDGQPWFWVANRYVVAEVWRCNGCGHLYFRPAVPIVLHPDDVRNWTGFCTDLLAAGTAFAVKFRHSLPAPAQALAAQTAATPGVPPAALLSAMNTLLHNPALATAYPPAAKPGIPEAKALLRELARSGSLSDVQRRQLHRLLLEHEVPTHLEPSPSRRCPVGHLDQWAQKPATLYA